MSLETTLYAHWSTIQWYRHAHAKDMPLRAIARLIQTMLYAQRFFPYYVYNILGGIEEDGKYHTSLPSYSTAFPPHPLSRVHWIKREWKCGPKVLVANTFRLLVQLGSGAVYSFDPVGSYEREACRAAGAAQSLVQPFLDNQVSPGPNVFLNNLISYLPTFYPLLYLFHTQLTLFSSSSIQSVVIRLNCIVYPILSRTYTFLSRSRYTSRTKLLQLGSHTLHICLYRMYYLSS